MGLKSDYEIVVECNGRSYTISELYDLNRCQALSHAVMVKRAKEGYCAEDMMLSGSDFKKKFKGKIYHSNNGKINKYPYADKTYSMKELLLLPECVVNKGCLTYRLRSGQDVHTAMTTPKGQNHGGKRVRGRKQSWEEVVENKVLKPVYKMRSLRKEKAEAQILVAIQEESSHTKLEQERIKKIMSVPVNNDKCRYEGHKVDMSDIANRKSNITSELSIEGVEYQQYASGIVVKNSRARGDN